MGPEKSFEPSETADDAQRPPSHTILQPTEQTVPFVFASPHSGCDYPPEFVAEAKLNLLALRRSEDAFVDQIYAAAPQIGAPLLRAHFPRVYVDPNREPFELDPRMFDEPLPDYVNARSPRVAAGLGTVAKVVATGETIYAHKLRFAETKQRIEAHYFPYHRALADLLDRTFQRFDCYLLIDCHSMPSIGGPMDADPGTRRVDFVLGDCYGTSCSPAIINLVHATLRDLGYSVHRNVPYAGGFTTRNYGRPSERKHTLQIEINRGLYMDEHRIAPTTGLTLVTQDLTRLMTVLEAAGRPMLLGR